MSTQQALFDPRPNLLSRRVVERITRPYREALIETYYHSFARYITCIDEDYRASIEQSPTVRPSMLQAYAVSQGIRELQEIDEDSFGTRITHCRLPNLKMVMLQRSRNKIILRWKKLNSDLLVPRQSMCSQKAHDYFNHEPVPEIDNTATRITIGYTVAPTGCVLTGVYLSSQIGETLRFAIELWHHSNSIEIGAEESSTNNPPEPPAPIRISTAQTRQRRAE